MPKGQPSKLTATRKKIIIEALETGAPFALACLYAKISYQTHRNWHLRGEKLREELDKSEGALEISADDKRYLDYFDDVQEAVGKALMTFLTTIYSAAVDDPAWAAWMLQRRMPEEFASKMQVGGTGTGGAVRIEIVEVVKDQGADGSEPTH
jgi:hypothetical protein